MLDTITLILIGYFYVGIIGSHRIRQLRRIRFFPLGPFKNILWPIGWIGTPAVEDRLVDRLVYVDVTSIVLHIRILPNCPEERPCNPRIGAARKLPIRVVNHRLQAAPILIHSFTKCKPWSLGLLLHQPKRCLARWFG